MRNTILILLKKNWKRLLTSTLLAGLIFTIGFPVILGIIEFFIIREGLKELKKVKIKTKKLNIRVG